MKRRLFVVALAVASLVAAPVLAQTPSDLLQKGIYTQETLGDLNGAIKIYRQLLAAANENRVYAAQAQYRLGLCLLAKGETAEAAVSAQVGAFALPPGSADSALITSLSPGNYTVELSGVGGTTGVGLAEVYEMNTADSNLMANISTRADVGVGGNILIAGFVVQGTQTANVLIRADGPALTEFNVTGVLAQPVLTVYNSSGAVVATNTGWGTNANAEQIASAAAEVGAFALANGSADSALLLTLPPGSYTAQVSGVGGGTGVALVEVYELK